MTEQEALIGLNLAGSIGARRLSILLQCFRSPQEVLRASVAELARLEGIGKKVAEDIRSVSEQGIEEELKRARKHNLCVITLFDPSYPVSLKHTPDPPLILYVKGRITEQDALSIAIVGSRRASFYGISCASRFAAELSLKGLTIVSGLARGIDTAAHRGALRSRGRTIAVMGSGFGNIYPPENIKLLEEIAENGAAVSEFPVCTQPLKQNFPRRNRIISGLSLGVLVVEAARNSGALITADCALEQGREVFALPGAIDSPTSFGAHELIKQGARLVSAADEIIAELNIPLTNPVCADKISGKQKPPVSPAAEMLLERIKGRRPVTLDEILQEAGSETGEVYRMLLELEAAKRIKQLPGKVFVESGYEG